MAFKEFSENTKVGNVGFSNEDLIESEEQVKAF
jgi:hypothetical protein